MPGKVLRIFRQEGIAGIVKRVQNRGYLPRPRVAPYAEWMRRNEPDGQGLALQREKTVGFVFRPTFSILMPVFSGSAAWLRRAVESVLDQTYERWELCIADGGSKEEIRSLLREYGRKDSRIRLALLDENLGISGNSNAALSLASGEFVGFLDHDDELAPFALFELAAALQGDPQADFLYSDEDKINSRGRRFDPVFKPDWSPDFLLSCNYITHLAVLRRSLVEEIGGFRSRFDGSQDYDLFLRATEETDRVRHIPRVLYHWRVHPQSASSSPDAKTYAYDAAVAALEDALTRRGKRWRSVGKITPGYYRVRYEIPVPAPHVTVVVFSSGDSGVSGDCIDSIAGSTRYSDFSVISVERGGSLPAALNAAVRSSQQGLVVFLDGRIGIPSPDWIGTMLELAQDNGIGAVGGKVVTSTGKVRHAGYLLGVGGLAGYAHSGYRADSAGYLGRLAVNQNLSAVPIECMMVRSDVFLEAGGFDEEYRESLFDLDLCLRLRERGMRIVMTPFAAFLWRENREDQRAQVPGMNPLPADSRLFRRKWARLIDAGDPCYSPNLRRDRPDFSLGR